MKKIFVFVICSIITIQCFGKKLSHGQYGFNSENICAVECTGYPWQVIYYCGNQSKGCTPVGYDSHSGNEHRWKYYGDSLTLGGTTYYCCGDSTKSGKFVKGPWTKPESKTIEVSGGTCTYTITKNACGKVISDVPCTKPDSCTNGKVMRNGECVAPCTYPMAFESKISNTCVECETTNYRGIAYDSTGGYCKQCDKAVEFFNKKRDENTPENELCIKKADIKKQYTATTMKKCWKCNPDDKQKCYDLNGDMTLFTMPESCGRTYKPKQINGSLGKSFLMNN